MMAVYFFKLFQACFGEILNSNHPKPTVLYVPQYVANFVSKKSCSI